MTTKEQELRNKKIGEWLGWNWNIGVLVKDNQGKILSNPRFTHNFNLILYYVEPKLTEKGFYVTMDITPYSGYHAAIYNRADKNQTTTHFQ